MFYKLEQIINQILEGDALTQLKLIPSESIDCIITSPPYWALRDYKVEGQIGVEKTIDEYVNNLTAVFTEAKRVLKKTGTIFIVLGDTYGEDKSLCLVPEKFAQKMVDNGFILRSKIIWYKPNCIPSSVNDRFGLDWEYIFMFTKSRKYYFKLQYEPYSESTIKEFKKAYNGKGLKDYEGNNVQNPSDIKRRIVMKGQRFGGNKHKGYGTPTYSGKEWTIDPDKFFSQGRRKRSVWRITLKGFHQSHFAIFPEELVKQCLDAGCPPDEGIILDMFMGAGTTALTALKNNRRFIGIELNPDYIKIAQKRIEPYLKQQKLNDYIFY